MSKCIQDLKGIGPKYKELLKQHGINSTDKFLQVCGNREGRKGLSEKTSINEKNILKWVNLCDLFRINGIAAQYVILLEASGVNTLDTLRAQNAEILTLLMADVNNEKSVCKTLPSTKTVTRWVQQAKELSSMVTS